MLSLGQTKSNEKGKGGGWMHSLVEQMVVHTHFAVRFEVIRHEHYGNVHMIQLIDLQTNHIISKICLEILSFHVVVMLVTLFSPADPVLTSQLFD